MKASHFNSTGRVIKEKHVDSKDMQLQNIVVFSHRRSGTHLTIDIIRNNFAEYHDAPVNIDALRDPSRAPSIRRSLQKAYDERSSIIMKSHSPGDLSSHFVSENSLREALRAIRGAKRIYVYRDGRDVLASLYCYLQDATPAYRSLTFSQFLRSSILPTKRPRLGHLDVVDYWSHHVESWRGQSEVLLISFEDILHDYKGVVRRLSSFLDLPMPDSVRCVIRQRSYSGRSAPASKLMEKLFKLYNRHFRGLDFSTVDFRAGQVGSYAVHFSPEDLLYFESRAGSTMQLLGYGNPSDPVQRTHSS